VFASPASLAGTYGAFGFDAATGAWGYTLANAQSNVQALTAVQTVTDTLHVASLDGTATRDIVVSIAGTNDIASIGGSSTGAVIEDGIGLDGRFGGALFVTDADAGEAGFAATDAGAHAGTYGSFSFNAGFGVWTYTLNSAAATVQALAAGQTATDTLTVHARDGSATRDIVISIGGANDAAAIAGTTTGSVAEDGTQTAGGRLTVTDVDTGQAVFRTPASLTGTYGSFSFDAATGAWGYTLNNAAANVQALAAGQSVTDTLAVTALDGTASRTITVTIAGAADGVAPIRLTDVAQGSGGFKIIGQDSYDDAGGSVAAAGDVNGDGLADLLVGASLNDATGIDFGAAYVVFGKAGGTAVNLDAVALGTGGFKVYGQNYFDGAGTSVAGVGDINGDGFADLLVGAPQNGSGGAAYLVFGKASGAAVNLATVAAGSGGFMIVGDAFGDRAGERVAGVGDVDGDGRADLLVGATLSSGGGSQSGASYVVFGKTSGTAVDLGAVALGIGGFKIIGEDAGDRAAFVSAAGDVNGDGRADLLIGALGNDAGGADSGAAYVVFGKAGGTGVNLDAVALGTGGFKIIGEAAGDKAAIVSAAGDINGDGLADLLVGAANTGASNSGRGAAYVVFGKTSGAVVDLDAVALGTGGFKIIGEMVNGFAGVSVAGVGDLNGDGVRDLLIGAGGASNAAYVVFGKASGTTIDLGAVALGIGGFKILGEFTGDGAGATLSAAGDVNGDGRPDLLIGASANDAGGTNSGAAYVVFGSADWLL
ncbi:MAG: VCBS domain-containing protein, partial [Paracraurococcus sp.]